MKTQQTGKPILDALLSASESFAHTPAQAHSPLPENADAWYSKGKIVFRCEDGDFIAQAVSASAAQTFANEHNRKVYDVCRRFHNNAQRLADALKDNQKYLASTGDCFIGSRKVIYEANSEALAQWKKDNQ